VFDSSNRARSVIHVYGMAPKRLASGYTGEAPVVATRIVPADRERLIAAAAAAGTTTGEYLRAVLRQHLDDQDRAATSA
jgi:hypothetical protein